MPRQIDLDAGAVNKKVFDAGVGQHSHAPEHKHRIEARKNRHGSLPFADSMRAGAGLDAGFRKEFRAAA
jgi:hypothetical protein